MLFLLLGACGFNVEGTGQETTIDGLGILCPPDLGDTWLDDTVDAALNQTFALVLNSVFQDISTEIEAQKTGPARTITLEQLDLVMTSAPAQPSDENTLGFLDNIDVYIALDDETPVLTVSAADIPTGETDLAMDPEPINLKPYLDQGFTLSIDFNIRECPRDDIVVRPEYQAHVKL